MSRLILISVKQQYVQEILLGRKTIELRKSKPKVQPGDTIVIYTTQPIKAVTAIATVGNIITCSPTEMWNKNKSKLGINKQDFFSYYNTSTKAVGIELLNITKLDADILLSAIKLLAPSFAPPQTFKYLNKFETFRLFSSINNGIN